MADFGGSQSKSFGLGVDHQANSTGHQNAFSMSPDARDDQGLTDDSERLNDLTPQGVTQVGTGQEDSAFEQYQRAAGSYQPGTLPGLMDKVDQGSDRRSVSRCPEPMSTTQSRRTTPNPRATPAVFVRTC